MGYRPSVHAGPCRLNQPRADKCEFPSQVTDPPITLPVEQEGHLKNPLAQLGTSRIFQGNLFLFLRSLLMKT